MDSAILFVMVVKCDEKEIAIERGDGRHSPVGFLSPTGHFPIWL